MSDFPAQGPVGFSNVLMAGYSLGTLHVFPVQYSAATGALIYHHQIEVQIQTSPRPDKDVLSGVRGSPVDRARVAALVQNPEALAAYDPPRGSSGMLSPGLPGDAGPLPLGDPPASYQYVIITSAALEASFQPLVNQKQLRGLTAAIVTTEYIYSNYSPTEDHTNDSPGQAGINADKILNHPVVSVVFFPPISIPLPVL